MIASSIVDRQPDRSAKAAPDACVFVIDDDVSVRESLVAMLEAMGLWAKGFACASEFLAHPTSHAPSCLLLDVVLPDAHGLDLQARFGANGVAIPIIFISGYVDVPVTVRAMRAGAFEFLLKPLSEDTVMDAIARALATSRDAIRQEADTRSLRERCRSLTCREDEVMKLVVAGKLNKQIAADLSISEITVKAHRGKMMRKMLARSVPDLVKMAARLGVT